MPVEVATGQATIGAIVADATHLFWAATFDLDTSTNPQSTLWTVPIPSGSTGSAPTAFATGQSGITRIRVDATHVYWVNIGNSTVMRGALSGGAPSVVSTFSGQRTIVEDIALHATYVYVAISVRDQSDIVSGSIVRVPLAGGTQQSIATFSGDPERIALNASHVYWTAGGVTYGQPGGLHRVPIDGGTPETLVGGQTLPTEISLTQTTAFWATTAGAILSVSLAGGLPTTVANDQNWVRGLQTDATHVYWTSTNSPSVAQVRRAPLIGGTSTAFADVTPLEPASLALDTVSIYVAANYGSANNDKSKIFRITKSAIP